MIFLIVNQISSPSSLIIPIHSYCIEKTLRYHSDIYGNKEMKISKSITSFFEKQLIQYLIFF